MARDALWKGFVSFGLVEIPVDLVAAEERHELAFHLFDRRNRAPVGNRRVNKQTGKEVAWEDVVKGYEYEPDTYVLFSDEELRAANAKANQTIEILDFVDAAEVHPGFFGTPYYLRPARKRAHKTYALLHEVLRTSGRMGIARVVLRTREHLAGLTIRGPALMLCLLRFAHELRDPDVIGETDASIRKAGVTKAELALAGRLVEGMSGPWKPEKYTDRYHDDVLAMIEKKVKAGELEPIDEPESEPRPARHGDVLDLMPLLKRSVEGGGAASGKAGKSKARTRRKAPRTRRAAPTRARRRPAPRRRSA